jgi:hypothetical protein
MLTGRFVGSFKVIGKLADENTGILVSVFAASFQENFLPVQMRLPNE